MKGSNFLARAVGVALIVGFAAPAFAGSSHPMAGKDRMPAQQFAGPALANWDVDAKRGVDEINAQRYASGKAPTDKVTVYRPLPVCRLIDTRGTGTGGQITINGPLVGGSSTDVNTGGFCGIDGSGIAGLSVSFHVQNLTPNNGGYISFLQIGAPVAGTNAVFNVGAEWTAATANISIPNSSGDFKIFIAQSTVEVVVDVNGYYEDLADIEVGAETVDYTGNTTLATFEITNTNAAGTALQANGPTAGGEAFRIGSGKFAISGANTLNGTRSAFVHDVDSAIYPTGTRCSATLDNFSIIDHPMLDNNPSAVIFVQPRDASSAPPTTPPLDTIHAWYFVTDTGCDANVAGKWALRARNGTALTTDMRFNVLIITN